MVGILLPPYLPPFSFSSSSPPFPPADSFIRTIRHCLLFTTGAHTPVPVLCALCSVLCLCLRLTFVSLGGAHYWWWYLPRHIICSPHSTVPRGQSGGPPSRSGGQPPVRTRGRQLLLRKRSQSHPTQTLHELRLRLRQHLGRRRTTHDTHSSRLAHF